MILTCSTCGHRGEDGNSYAHDCYWVFRERGHNAGMAKKRGYSDQFPTTREKRVYFMLDKIPPALWIRVKAKAKREGVSLRSLMLGWCQEWVDGKKPSAKSGDQPTQEHER